MIRNGMQRCWPFENAGRSCDLRSMTERITPSLQTALSDVMKWLDASHIPSMIIGGVATSMLGRARLTQDIDALVLLPQHDWADALSSAALHGIMPRIADPLAFAHRSRMLLLTHAASKIDIDVSLGGLSFEQEAIGRSRTHEMSGLHLRLPSVEDL